MKNRPNESGNAPKQSLPDWRLETLRPFLKKFQQNLRVPELEINPSHPYKLSWVFFDDEYPENFS
jgi:hypothetical protein